MALPRRILFLSALALIGCRGAPPSPSPDAAHEPLIHRVEFAGCAEVLEGPICEVDGRQEVVVWVAAHPKARLELRLTLTATESPVLSEDWTPIQGGRRATVMVPARATRVDVLAHRQGQDRWTLRVRPRVWNPAVQLAARAFSEGQLEACQQQLAALPDGPGLDARARADLARVRARLAMAHGDAAESLKQRALAVEQGRAAKLVSKVVNEQLSFAFTAMTMSRDVAQARAALESLNEGHLALVASGAVHRDHYLGMLAAETGDLRGAIRQLERAAHGADRLKLGYTAWAAAQEQVGALVTLGMPEAAERILDAWSLRPDRPDDACAQATTLDNATWVALTAGALGVPTQIDPVDSSKRALALWQGACPRPEQVKNTLVNLALSGLQAGHTVRAKAWLTQARRLGRASVQVALWALDLEGRIALAEGRTQAALTAYASLEALATTAASPDGQWRAEIGRADAWRARGDIPRARRAFARAEGLLEAQLLSVSIGPDRGRFAALREASLERQIELLLVHGTPAEVVAVVQRSRARVLAGLERQSQVAALQGEARQRWEAATSRYLVLREQLDSLVADSWGQAASRAAERERRRRTLEVGLMQALDDAAQVGLTDRPVVAVPTPGLTLGFRPLARGVLGFMTGAGPPRVVKIPLRGPEAPPAELAAGLLGPFAAELAAAPRVRIEAEGWLAGLDLHALPWGEGALLDALVVTYGLGSGAAPPRPSRPTRALIVADPSGDLPGARDEGRAVQESLQDQGRATSLLVGRAADRRAVMAALGAADTFHYAGHGHYRGIDGWQSALPLASASELSVSDILTSTAVPAQVVLSGCETAQTSALAAQDLGLARAFVLRGAAQVLAATRPVRDEVAQAITRAVHAPGIPDLAAGLRAAQQDLRARDPDADWAAFRVVVP